VCECVNTQPQANFLPDGAATNKQDMVKMPGLKGKDYGKATTKYPDFTATENGNNDVFIHT
jgi:hypothetical protein